VGKVPQGDKSLLFSAEIANEVGIEKAEVATPLPKREFIFTLKENYDIIEV